MVAGRTLVSIGAAVRAKRGESVAGDESAVVRWSRGSIAVLADGLGHGPLAALAAQALISSVRLNPELSLEDILAYAHRHMRGTRGAVAAIARFDESAHQVEVGSVGNIATFILRARGYARVHPLAVPGVLGSAYRTVRVQEYPFGLGDVMVMHSDGVRGPLDFVDLSEMHPEQVAARILEEHSRDNDDAACVVARSALATDGDLTHRAAVQTPRTVHVCTPGDAECAAFVSRMFAREVGLNVRAQWEVSIAASELASNAMKFAGEGTLNLSRVDEPQQALVLEMTDNGSGIRDVAASVVDGFSEGAIRSPDYLRTGRGLGFGLGCVHRMMDEVQISTSPRMGTKVTAKKYMRR
jgi:anti-sigma regulatory factor (Ser/Thr protein kinase)